MLPVFPTFKENLASPPGQKVQDFEAHRVSFFSFFAWTWPLWWKKDLFHQRGQIWGFSTKPLHCFNFPFKHLRRKYDQNRCVIFCAYAENSHWWHPVQIILHWLYSQSFYNWVISQGKQDFICSMWQTYLTCHSPFPYFSFLLNTILPIILGIILTFFLPHPNSLCNKIHLSMLYIDLRIVLSEYLESSA